VSESNFLKTPSARIDLDDLIVTGAVVILEHKGDSLPAVAQQSDGWFGAGCR